MKYKTVLDSAFPIVDARFQAKLGFWVPLIVGWDFGFLELCSEFQNPAFLIPQSNFPRSGFPSTNFPDS